jgi:hypothetical protein
MTGDMPAARSLRDASAAETGEGEPIEVTFSHAEPQLTPGAARAVLACSCAPGKEQTTPGADALEASRRVQVPR